jgi:hypothetical protein
MLMMYQIYSIFALLLLNSLAFYLGDWTVTIPTLISSVLVIWGLVKSLKPDAMGPFLGIIGGLILVVRDSILMVRDFSIPALFMGFTAVFLVPLSVMAVIAIGPKGNQKNES